MSRGLLHEIVGEFVAEADGCFVGRTGESCLQGGDFFTLAFVSWRRQLLSCRRKRELKSIGVFLLHLTCAVI